MIAWVIEEEFGVRYHPGHVRKLLHGLGFSVQRPRRVLARADASEQDRWRRRTYPTLKKSPQAKLGADLQRRSQLPTGLDFACHLEPRRPAAGNPRHGTAQERQDPGRHRTVAHALPLSAGHGLPRQDLLGIPKQLARRYRRQGARSCSSPRGRSCRTVAVRHAISHDELRSRGASSPRSSIILASCSRMLFGAERVYTLAVQGPKWQSWFKGSVLNQRILGTNSEHNTVIPSAVEEPGPQRARLRSFDKITMTQRFSIPISAVRRGSSGLPCIDLTTPRWSLTAGAKFGGLAVNPSCP